MTESRSGAPHADVIEIHSDTVFTHGADLGRMIDIIVSGMLLSNNELQRLNYADARTFNFPGDVTHGNDATANSRTEAHNVCVAKDTFYGISSITQCPAYLVLPARQLAQAGYRVMDQDGLHILPPDYQGPADERGCRISLTETPFKIVTDEPSAKILTKAMKESGLYRDEQIENAFLIADDVKRAVNQQCEKTIAHSKRALGLEKQPQETITLFRDDAAPKILTRAFPDGDRSSQYYNPTPEIPYAPREPNASASLNTKPVLTNLLNMHNLGKGLYVSTEARKGVRSYLCKLDETLNPFSYAGGSAHDVFIVGETGHIHGAEYSPQTGRLILDSFAPKHDRAFAAICSAMNSRHIRASLRENLRTPVHAAVNPDAPDSIDCMIYACPSPPPPPGSTPAPTGQTGIPDNVRKNYFHDIFQKADDVLARRNGTAPSAGHGAPQAFTPSTPRSDR
ncbi:MAG: hypothetical protein H6865_07005 [Rhodospirillales bacterium]|nr:hypothetical protein [Alphaproteobacteria bacterium]MCB9987365.1 hypothetical protein [Rhodospirillales bacterium]USO07787.1 MAG: hypothetical protein H6866_00700 [Rhodospirillales bacterium]